MTMVHSIVSVSWRDCQSDPPDDETRVLVYTESDGEVSEAYKCGDDWYYGQSDIPINTTPKLWAHVPFPEGHKG